MRGVFLGFGCFERCFYVEELRTGRLVKSPGTGALRAKFKNSTLNRKFSVVHTTIRRARAASKLCSLYTPNYVAPNNVAPSYVAPNFVVYTTNYCTTNNVGYSKRIATNNDATNNGA